MVDRAARIALTLCRWLGTLLAIHLLSFALLNALPGDPAARLAGPEFSAESAARMRETLRLDGSWPERYWASLGALARGRDLISLSLHRPVDPLLEQSLPPSLSLGAAGLAVGLLFGLLGARALWPLLQRRRRAAEDLLVALGVLPRFWLGLMLVFLFHDRLGWLPASHMTSPGTDGASDRLLHLILPALTLALPLGGLIARLLLLRAIEPAAQGQWRQARALGLSRRRAFWRYLMTPQLPALLALLAAEFPLIISAAVVVEVVFSWPGIGQLVADAILSADQPLALAAIVRVALFAVIGLALAGWLATRIGRRAVGRRA